MDNIPSAEENVQTAETLIVSIGGPGRARRGGQPKSVHTHTYRNLCIIGYGHNWKSAETEHVSIEQHIELWEIWPQTMSKNFFLGSNLIWNACRN
jgi:hypothetical protein